MFVANKEPTFFYHKMLHGLYIKGLRLYRRPLRVISQKLNVPFSESTICNFKHNELLSLEQKLSNNMNELTNETVQYTGFRMGLIPQPTQLF